MKDDGTLKLFDYLVAVVQRSNLFHYNWVKGFSNVNSTKERDVFYSLSLKRQLNNKIPSKQL